MSSVSFNGALKVQMYVDLISGELLNFLLLGVQFLLTDKFLHNKFMWYGWSVVQYYGWSHEDRNDKELGLK